MSNTGPKSRLTDATESLVLTVNPADVLLNWTHYSSGFFRKRVVSG